MCRVLGEQLVQERRARARKAHYEQRSLDHLFGDFRVASPVRCQLQTVPEQFEELSLGDVAPKGRESRVRFERLY